MTFITSVFQFEIRYSHILNFSQIARGILAPYVKLANSIKLESQNSIEERIIFNFEDDDYMIIVSWDRILIKGQGKLDKFTEPNSAFQTPFLTILDQIKSQTEFGEIKNVLLAAYFIRKLELKNDSELVDEFMTKGLTSSMSEVLDMTSDVAIILEDKSGADEFTITFGPYLGEVDIMKRQLVPVNPESLGDLDFKGTMLEYKHFKNVNEFTFNDFGLMVKKANQTAQKVWQKL